MARRGTPPPPGASARRARAGRWPADRIWLAAGLLLVSLNLRPAIVAVSPLLSTIRSSLGLSGAAVGLLTALPLLCFGLLAPLAPRLVHRRGTGAVLSGCLIVLLVGVIVRSLPGLFALFAGTLLVGVGVAIANVLMPGIVKQDFPSAIGLMSGLYTMMLSAGAALSAGATVPLDRLMGRNWHLAIGFWALPVAVALIVWLLSYAKENPTGIDVPPRIPVTGLWRSPVAWAVTVFMGVQSLEFYAMVTWLPTIFHGRGTSVEDAGFLLALVSFFGILGALVTPWLVHRANNQRLAVGLSVGAVAVGTAGLLFFPHQLDILWAMLLGWGQGAGIGLALLFMVLRTQGRGEAMALSGMAQGVGYLIASVGPVMIGGLFDLSGKWSVPLAVLLVLLGVQAMAGDLAARNRTVLAAPATSQ